MTPYARKQSRPDLFTAVSPREQRMPAATRPASLGPRICAFCGAFAPFGKGNIRTPETLVWACREHRKDLG
jgi:hypothetical protein